MKILKKSKSLWRGLPPVLFSPNSSQNINNANERLGPKRNARAGSRVEERARWIAPHISTEYEPRRLCVRVGWGGGTAVMVGQ